ncbi:MAG: hypothetical protein LBJ63_10335 [Prevotellaceae bacterium]|nr:hypothetical protein [Prevotellaceae bacterium]
MKKYLFIIGLWAACVALPNTVKAQWGFTVTQGQSGNCVGCDDIKITVINIGSIPVNGFPTRQECEAARQTLVGIRQAFVCGCTLYVICSSCTGKDIAGFDVGGNTNDGSVRVSGTSQGSSYYTPNSFDALQDAYDQKNFQNEVLLGTDQVITYNELAITGDINFDTRFKKLYGGRPVPGFIQWNPEENRIKDGYEAKGSYQLMKELGEKYGLNLSNYLSEDLWNKMGNKAGGMSSSEIAEFNKQYDKYVSDVRDKQKRQDPIFNVFDEAWASTKEKVKEDAIIRAQGAMQALGGAFGVVSGYTIATGGEIFAPGVAGVAGAIVAADGVDNIQTGMRQLFTGKETDLVTDAIGLYFGLQKNTITNAVGIIDLGTSVRSISKSIFKAKFANSAKSGMNAKVVTSNSETIAKLRNLSSNKGGKIIKRPPRKFTDEEISSYAQKWIKDPDNTKNGKTLSIGRFRDKVDNLTSTNIHDHELGREMTSYLDKQGEYSVFNNLDYTKLKAMGYSEDEIFKINAKAIEFCLDNDYVVRFSHNPNEYSTNLFGTFKKEMDVIKKWADEKNLKPTFKFDKKRKEWILMLKKINNK